MRLGSMKFLLAVILVMGMAGSAFAGTCTTASFSTYDTSGFSCTFDGLTFSNFSVSNNAGGSAVALTDANITVTPMIINGIAYLEFSAGWSAGTGSFQDSLIQFQVSGPAITDLHLDFNGAFTGTGLAGVTEQYCTTGPIAGCPGGSQQLIVTNPPPTFGAVATFDATQTVYVSKDIQVSGGTNGTASISQVFNGFSTPVPEPGSLALLGSGLLSFGGFLRRKLGKK